MPRKPKAAKPSAEVLAPIPAEILDQMVRDGPLPAAEVETAPRRFKNALIERALGAELTTWAYALARPNRGRRSSHWDWWQTVWTDDAPVPIEVPRDRNGTLDPD